MLFSKQIEHIIWSLYINAFFLVFLPFCVSSFQLLIKLRVCRAIASSICTCLHLITHGKSCWMNETPYNTVLIAPVCLSMLLNLLFLCNIVRVLLLKLRAPAGPQGAGAPSRNILQAFRWVAWLHFNLFKFLIILNTKINLSKLISTIFD